MMATGAPAGVLSALGNPSGIRAFGHAHDREGHFAILWRASSPSRSAIMFAPYVGIFRLVSNHIGNVAAIVGVIRIAGGSCFLVRSTM
jgi:hypothetical protein